MVESRIHRRLAAILAADVAGYSRLMGEDEEATLRTLKSHREIVDELIDRHEGRVFGTAGDSVMAEFGSAVEAVRAAIAIQEALKARNAELPDEGKMVFRIGVNLGDVMIEAGDVYGDGVNLAARIEGLCQPGEVYVSEIVQAQVEGRLPVGFEDKGEHAVKNIARPVRIYRVTPEQDPKGLSTSPALQPKRRSRTVLIGAVSVLVLAITAIGTWMWEPWNRVTEGSPGGRSTGTIFGKPSIAVLPFENLANSKDDEFFSNGTTEDIISALGRYSSLAVMAYNASSSFRTRDVDPVDVGRRLGVRYVVQGSVRRVGLRARVSVRLTDTQRRLMLWSQTFDEQQSDMFAIQDAVTRRIAGSLVANLDRVEQQRAFAKPTQNLEAYELVLRARARLTRASRRSNREARRLFERAIELDPDYAAAYAWLARAYYHMARDGWTEFADRDLKRGEEHALKALAIDPDSVEAHRTLGRIYGIRFQLDRAIAEIDKAIGLNSSYAEAYGDRGLILLWIGRLKEAAEALDTAFAYDPNLAADFVFAHGLTHYSLRRHAEAVKILERGASVYPNFVFIQATLVAAYGQLGRVDEARRNAEKVRSLMPIFDPRSFGRRFQNRAHYDYLMDGLRKGGML